MNVSDTLAEWVRDARQRTLTLLADLSDEQLRGSPLPALNPLLWELGHAGWFHEKWVLRRDGTPSLRSDADSLYDPSVVSHSARWNLPLPSRDDTLTYIEKVQQRVLEQLSQGSTDVSFVALTVAHEDLRGESWLATRQTLGYAPPRLQPGNTDPDAGPLPDDAEVPGGTFSLGVAADAPLYCNNEKGVHPVELKSFAIARAPVTQGEFANFVDRGGYHRPQLWSLDGLRWRQATEATQPVYWKRTTGGAWTRREFDRWVPLEPHRPMMHVNWYEAEAYCRWVNRRLPTEAEWEVAATAEPDASGGLASGKRPFPWGATPPTPATVNADGLALGALDVATLPAGDSAFGCRQMLGNVWEWTASEFQPYPGFAPGPGGEGAASCFGTYKVLRGGGWASRVRILRPTWRGYHSPDRRDIWAGFRTCAL